MIPRYGRVVRDDRVDGTELTERISIFVRPLGRFCGWLHGRGQPDGFQKFIFSELKKKYPECAAQIDEYLDGLTVEWSKLENDSAEKEKELFNQHKNEILEKSAADLEL